MQHERSDLEALFSPEPGQFGTHMLICGLSADTDTLERIMSAFTSEAKTQRASTGRLRSVLMLDAHNHLGSPRAVPGMLQLAPCAAAAWSKQTSLMHAKVALMAFSDMPLAAPTSLRLVVSTGNWTRESWGNGTQIDMYWSSTCTVLQPGEKRTPEHDDAAAALAFFSRMMTALYPKSAAFLQQQSLAMGWLDDWKVRFVAGKPGKRTRFIHSLDLPLFNQIKKMFPKSGITTLVAGSGFFEQQSPGKQAKPVVLTKLEELGAPSKRYLVSNPQQAGALANWVDANLTKRGKDKLDGWALCLPADPLQTRPALARTRLHAKYIAGLKRVSTAKNETGTLGVLYLGSGNLSRSGLLSRAALATDPPRSGHPGNIEAGIFMDNELAISQVWQALACGDLLAPDAMKAMESGEGEPIFKPIDPPPILFARIDDGHLHLVRSSGESVALQLKTIATNPWLDIGDGEDAAGFACPSSLPVVWIRTIPTAAIPDPEIHEIPVFAVDGTLCRQPPPELSVDDVLDALLGFPSAPPDPPEPPPSASMPVGPKRKASASAASYPLRIMAALIEVIGQRNATLTREQFPYWLSELRMLLLEQITESDRQAVMSANVNLFPALVTPGFVPHWLDQNQELKVAYETLLADIERAWTTSVVCVPTAVPIIKKGVALEE